LTQYFSASDDRNTISPGNGGNQESDDFDILFYGKTMGYRNGIRLDKSILFMKSALSNKNSAISLEISATNWFLDFAITK